MTGISKKISQMIEVADAIGAPHFSLDTLLAAARVIEANISAETDKSEMVTGIPAASGCFFPATHALEADLALIDAGARQALAWVVDGANMLPDSIDTNRGAGANGPLGIAYSVATKYV